MPEAVHELWRVIEQVVSCLFREVRVLSLWGVRSARRHRLPATVGYLNPAIQVTLGVHRFTLGVPVRFYKDFQPSYLDEAGGKLGGGGLAKYMILAQYIVRF